MVFVPVKIFYNITMHLISYSTRLARCQVIVGDNFINQSMEVKNETFRHIDSDFFHYIRYCGSSSRTNTRPIPWNTLSDWLAELEYDSGIPPHG